MKKFLRKLFNRTTLVLFILVVEFAFIVAAVIICNEFSDPESFFGSRFPNLAWIGLIDNLLILFLLVFQVIIFFRVIYRQMDAEFKIPWIIILLLLPLLGSLIYIVFGRRNLKKKEARLLNTSDGISAKFFLDKPNIKEDGVGDYHKAIDYLDNNSILKAHNHNHVTYFKNGETFFPDMVEKLKEAEEFIFIEFFIVGEGQEWTKVREILVDKASKGVDVRIIYDDFGSFAVLKGGEANALKKLGIKCYKYNKFKPFVSGVYNNRDHRKIVVIDHKYGYTGGMNLADEYANEEERFGYWKDTMVRIEGSAINNLIHLFLTNFDLCQKKSSDHASFLKYDYPKFNDKGLVYPFGHGPAPYFKERVGENTLINIIESAQETLYISTPYFIPSESLLYSIRRSALNGVNVYLFLPGIPDKKLVFHVAETYFRTLMQAGVHIMLYRPGFNHMKTVIADGKLAFVGTINCDYRSLVHHFECGTLIYDAPCCEDIVKDFDEMMIESGEVRPESFQMGKFVTFICVLIKPFISLL